MVMDIMQVVQNHEQPLTRIATPQPDEGLRNFPDALPASEHTVQAIGMHIVESEKLLRDSRAAVGRTGALRLFPSRPSDAAQGFQFQRSPLVEAHYRGAWRAAPIKRPDAFFFTIKIRVAGSFPGAHALGTQSFASQQAAHPVPRQNAIQRERH